MSRRHSGTESPHRLLLALSVALAGTAAFGGGVDVILQAGGQTGAQALSVAVLAGGALFAACTVPIVLGYLDGPLARR